MLGPAAMEVNRDEAERCIDIAITALTNNQPKKAQRFLEKGQRLFPTEKANGEQLDMHVILPLCSEDILGHALSAPDQHPR